MCLELLNPIRICEFACGLCFCAFLVVFGGYLGKGVYLYSGTSVTPLHVVQDPNFYVPDGTFWACGFAVLILLFAFMVLMRALFVALQRCVDYIFCHMCCGCHCKICGKDESKDEKQRKKMEKYRKVMRHTYYTKLDDLEAGIGHEGEDDDEYGNNTEMKERSDARRQQYEGYKNFHAKK